MGKQKMKVIKAGRFYRVVLYSTAHTPDTGRARAERQRITTEARRRINLRTSWQKLQLLIEANFRPGDSFVTLSYDEEHLPRTRQEARRQIKAFIRLLRQELQGRKQALKYIYCIEGLHGGKRLHHHILLNVGREDLPLLCRLWKYGSDADVNIETYKARDSAALAQYMTKEPRNGNMAEAGARCWAGSQNLEKPTVFPTQWVDANVRLDVPANAYVVTNQSEQNEWGRYDHLEYYEPEPPKRTWQRPKQNRKSNPAF